MGWAIDKPWRVGRHLVRTVYVQMEDEPSDIDTFLGIFDSEQIAAYVFAKHNEELR